MTRISFDGSSTPAPASQQQLKPAMEKLTAEDAPLAHKRDWKRPTVVPKQRRAGQPVFLKVKLWPDISFKFCDAKRSDFPGNCQIKFDGLPDRNLVDAKQEVPASGISPSSDVLNARTWI
ncbi:hypothetical protein CLIM01_01024 [Colletotrichum limetticola]|uniref:Uncharacterized protein n=1 Tax=Colletotrichum limetticola TaxID=1209924 RepID=A0ABQ9QCV3_9PEZI|nr:hypothetical protein CLIM01_01024 [Colletotrichum limetticola]